MTDTLDRRTFLQSSTGIIATAAAFHHIFPLRAEEKTVEPIRIALIGCGGMMAYHAEGLVRRKSPVRFTHLCDVDPAQAEKIAKTVSGFQSETPAMTARYEDVLDDRTVDAVIVATPHHWHMPITLKALEAGKDVYVEKPASHVFSEGPRLIEAAKKHGRIVQHGTQMRSSPILALAGKLLNDGVIGDIKVAKAWNVQQREKRTSATDCDAPPGVDYERWLGPAPSRPFNPDRFHSRWRAFPEYGNGTIGDDGVHDLDLARWGLGVTTHPVRITGHSSSILYKEAPQYPDNMSVTYQYADDKVLIYEDRQFAAYGLDGFDSGNAFYGTEGYMVLSRRGYFQVYQGPKSQKGPGIPAELRGDRSRGYAEHMENFLECVRSRQVTNAPPEIAHLSCGLVHLGDIACRSRQVLEFDPLQETISNHASANDLLGKQYRSPYGIPEGT